MRKVSALKLLTLVITLSGCASGQLNLYDTQGNKVGECTAGYDWHPYGVKDSVEWLLNKCYEMAIEQGIEVASVSDESIINKDYSYPPPSSGEVWNKKSAWQAFGKKKLTEREYGYLLADIENQYYYRNQEAEKQYNQGVISEDEYQRLLKESKFIFNGK